VLLKFTRYASSKYSGYFFLVNLSLVDILLRKGDGRILSLRLKIIFLRRLEFLKFFVNLSWDMLHSVFYGV